MFMLSAKEIKLITDKSMADKSAEDTRNLLLAIESQIKVACTKTYSTIFYLYQTLYIHAYESDEKLRFPAADIPYAIKQLEKNGYSIKTHRNREIHISWSEA